MGREEGSAPLAGVLVDLPCNEECAGSVPPVLAVCSHPQQSLAPGTLLLLQAFLFFFFWGSLKRETPIRVALVTLQVLPGLEKSKVFPRPPQHLLAQSSKDVGHQSGADGAGVGKMKIHTANLVFARDNFLSRGKTFALARAGPSAPPQTAGGTPILPGLPHPAQTLGSAAGLMEIACDLC